MTLESDIEVYHESDRPRGAGEKPELSDKKREELRREVEGNPKYKEWLKKVGVFLKAGLALPFLGALSLILKAKEKLAKLKSQVGEKEHLSQREERFEGEVDFYNQVIDRRVRAALREKQAYASQVTVENCDGSQRTIKNSCVGFVMKILENLPFKVTGLSQAKENQNRYVSRYFWGKSRGAMEGKTSAQFFPDLVGEDIHRYHTIYNPDHKTVDEEAARFLKKGEYAIASIVGYHLFLLHKDSKGRVRMIHSGTEIGKGGRALGSRVNETTLGTFLKYIKPARNKPITILPVRELVAVAKTQKNTEVAQYYRQNRDQAVA